MNQHRVRIAAALSPMVIGAELATPAGGCQVIYGAIVGLPPGRRPGRGSGQDATHVVLDAPPMAGSAR